MKLKDMVYLHEVSTMREFLENNGVVGATDNEIKAFYDVFEGHGYELFARNLKDNMFIRFDSCGSELGDIDETNEEYVSINDIGYELSYGWEMLEELYEEYWENGEEEQAFDCGIAMNLVSDLYSRYLDRNKNKVYVVSYSSRGNFSTTDDTTVEVFSNEVDAYKDIKKSIEFTMEHYNIEHDDYDSDNTTDFSNEMEVKKYMIDYRERDEFLLLHDEGSLQIKLSLKIKDKEEEVEVKEEPKMEFYTLIDHSVNENCYEDTVNVFHYRTKEEGMKNFDLIIEEYKQSFLDDGYELDSSDEVNEYENNNIMYFELFLEGICHIQVSLEKVVL